MRTRRLVWVYLVTVVVLAHQTDRPACCDDKPKADPPAKAKEADNRELHVVGLYEGFTRTGDTIHGNKALVTVDRPGKRVTLVLTAAHPMTWEVTLGKDTTLEKVILGGRERSRVKGIPAKVEVVEAFGARRSGLATYAYRVDSPEFRTLVDALDREVGLPIASFTGAYRAEAGVPLMVDEVQNSELLSADFPKVDPNAKFPKVTFLANHYVPGGWPHEMTVSFGEFTLAGPVADSLKPVPARVSRVAYDPAGKKYYGIADHGLAAIDMKSKKAAKIDLGLDVPEISWPADVTYDTKRDRLLLITSGGGGYLYGFYPKTERTEVLAEKLRLNNLTYHPKDDVLYSVKADREGGGELQHINAKGAVVKATKLDGPLVPGILSMGPGVQGAQLIPADDKLVLLVAPVGHRGSEVPGPQWSYMYLIDPKTGKTQLTWKSK
jgi:hypothetical protein